MARARNKATESTENTTELTEAEELAAIEAALNGDSDASIEIDDSDFSDVNEEELAAALAEEEKSSKKAAKKPAETAEASDEKKEAPKVNKTSTPNVTRDADAFAKAVVDILGDDAVLDSDEGPLTEDQMLNLMKDVTQIKVREKVLNLCNHIMNGRELNRYTQIAAKVLVDAQLDGCKPVTMADLKKSYEEAGYKPGTVNAQAGQMMALFRAMGMGKANGRGILIPNINSVLIDALASS